MYIMASKILRGGGGKCSGNMCDPFSDDWVESDDDQTTSGINGKNPQQITTPEIVSSVSSETVTSPAASKLTIYDKRLSEVLGKYAATVGNHPQFAQLNAAGRDIINQGTAEKIKTNYFDIKNAHKISVTLLIRLSNEMYSKLNVGERVIKYELLKNASANRENNASNPPGSLFPIDLSRDMDNHVRNFKRNWLGGIHPSVKPPPDLSFFYILLSGSELHSKAFADTPENQRRYYAAIYKALLTPFDDFVIDENEIERFDELYKLLAPEERKSKYGMLKDASNPKSCMKILPPLSNCFPINLNDETSEHVINFKSRWLRKKRPDAPSSFYSELVANHAFDDTQENKNIYYTIICIVLTVSPRDFFISGGKRGRTRKMKRRKGKTKRMTKLRRGRGRKTKRV